MRSDVMILRLRRAFAEKASRTAEKEVGQEGRTSKTRGSAG
jgi:hypothetical protein